MKIFIVLKDRKVSLGQFVTVFQSETTANQLLKPLHRLNPDQLSSGNWNLNCFTEGSKTEVSTGASYFIMGHDEHFPCFKRQESIHLGPFFTVFQSETSALPV